LRRTVSSDEGLTEKLNVTEKSQA